MNKGKTLLLDERGAHGSEGVDEHAVFEALAAVHHVRDLHQNVACLDYFGLVANGELEFAAFDVGDLNVRMAVELALRTLLELHFNHHKVVVVAHHLAIDFAWVTSALPFLVGIEYKLGALGGDVASIDGLPVVGHGNHSVGSCGEGTISAARFVTSGLLWLVALASYEQGGKSGCEKNLFHKKQF